MEIDSKQILDLIAENQSSIKEICSELAQLRYWIMGGVILAIPYALFIHRHIHPTERFFEKKIQEIDKLIQEAKKIIL